MDARGSSPTDMAYARFFRALGVAALDLAQELEVGLPSEAGTLSLDDANLGSLQRQVAHVPGMRSEMGVSPRQIAQHLDRGDEPNIRTALATQRPDSGGPILHRTGTGRTGCACPAADIPRCAQHSRQRHR